MVIKLSWLLVFFQRLLVSPDMLTVVPLFFGHSPEKLDRNTTLVQLSHEKWKVLELWNLPFYPSFISLILLYFYWERRRKGPILYFLSLSNPTPLMSYPLLPFMGSGKKGYHYCDFIYITNYSKNIGIGVHKAANLLWKEKIITVTKFI